MCGVVVHRYSSLWLGGRVVEGGGFRGGWVVVVSGGLVVEVVCSLMAGANRRYSRVPHALN